MKWFGSIGLFLHKYQDPRRIPKYELRTTICQARSQKIAEARFLREFADYAQDGTRFLEQWQVVDLYGAPGRIPLETSYQMITTDLSPKEFIKVHWLGDRPQSCEEMGWTHSWHNLDNRRSGCFNCRTVRKGRLWETEPNKATK